MRTGRFILFCALPRPCKPESARQAVMRCAAACRVAMHFMLPFVRKTVPLRGTYTSSVRLSRKRNSRTPSP